MKFNLTKASNYSHQTEKVVEINTVEELVDLSKEYEGKQLILSFFKYNSTDPLNQAEIMVYDDYIE